MGMTIDEAIKYYSNKNFVLTEEEAEANTIALNIMRKYQQLQADYENRLKADLKAILVELQLDVEEQKFNVHMDKDVWNDAIRVCSNLIQQRINELKAESEGGKMNKWIAEFDLEDGDTMPEHMDLEYKGARIDFHCRPLEQEPFDNRPCVSSGVCEHDKQKVLDKIKAEITNCLKALDEIEKSGLNIYLPNEISGRRLTYQQCLEFIDKYKSEREK